jgi:outer membrane protein TolC
VASVTKSFYSLLLTLEQITIYKEDTVRLSQSVTDAYHQFVGGIVDETDYDEASISLNNAKAQLRSAMEHVLPQYALLKQTMGYPPGQQFNVSFDTAEMARSIGMDTTQQLNYDKRIEYAMLKTTRELQHQLVDYYRLSFLPTISAYYDYNYPFANNSFSQLYTHGYPNSLIGLQLNLPLFTGFARLENIRKARLQEQIIDWDEVELKSVIYSQYAAALADYKSNLYNLYELQDNLARAQRVYFIVELQYKQGIVPYLNVITAESNLITSRIGYLNALYQVLSNKVDLQKAMGNITW